MGCCGSAEKSQGGGGGMKQEVGVRKQQDVAKPAPPTPTPVQPVKPKAAVVVQPSSNQNNGLLPQQEEKECGRMVRSSSSNCMARHRSEELRGHAGVLLKKQKKGMYEDWEKDMWPWPWMYAKPPHPKRSDSAAYSEFLNCFKILSTEETEAYAAWKGNNKEAARRIMANIRNKTEQPDAVLSPLDEDSASDEGKLEPKNSIYERHDVIRNPFMADVAQYEAPVYEKTPGDTRLILAGLRNCPLFAHLIRETELLSVASAMKEVTLSTGDVVFTQNEVPTPETSGFYVVKTGKLTSSASSGAVYSPGDHFGEYVVTSTNSKSTEGVVVKEGGVCFMLVNEVFSGVMAKLAHEKRETYKGWLKEIEFLKGQTAGQILQLADALEEKKYDKGEKIIEFQKTGDYMHFIVEGEVDVVGREKDDEGILLPDEPRYVCSFSPGHPVGYIEFFEVTPSKNIADVVARDEVITARINRRHFEKCMGAVKDLLHELTEAPEYAYYRETKEAQSPDRSSKNSQKQVVDL